MERIPLPDLTNESTFATVIAILITLLIAILLNTIIRASIKIPKTLDTRRGRTYIAMIKNMVTAVIFLIAAYVIAIMLNIDITPLIASAGIVGIAIGIGSRTIIEDLLSGFFLLTSDTVSIGDRVVIAGSIEGRIIDIGFRTIKIRGMNGSHITVPNGMVKQVVNFSRGEAIVDIDLPFKASHDIDGVIKLLGTVLQNLKTENNNIYSISEASKVLGVQNIATGNAMVVRVRIVTTPAYRLVVDREYRYRVLKAVKKQKIELA